MIELNPHLQQHLPRDLEFDAIMQWSGTVHRAVKNRRTIEITIGGQTYFAKIHRGAGWREIWKNLLYGRAPIVSAANEWRAIERLTRLGVPTLTVAGKGIRGRNPARLESFVITEALVGMISLEDLTRDWRGMTVRQRVVLKRALINSIADIARTMHEAGLNHRDFYLCHFLVKDRDWTRWQPGTELEPHLIDLHRVQQRPRVPERWVVKDVGGLLFSALDAGLTRRDLLRFMARYRQRPWRDVWQSEPALWRRVWQAAVRLYVSFHKRPPPLSW